MATRGRKPGTPKVPGSGRKRGSLDKAARQLISGEVANDILSVYRALGGAAFLLDYAKAQPGSFIRDCLARLMPPMPKEDVDVLNQNLTINASNLSDFEAARRVAFCLAKAAYEQGLEMTPQQACNAHWQSPATQPDRAPAPTSTCRKRRSGAVGQ
ncbi:hypothetical protein NVV94_20000 [Pseudomonas sp. LS1212]|uniref:hypothetical protein n=1 Tax=Pseudomonas sp. LS1212 TaxID=2972478 RepID=UPI00215D4C10|nr:hypothetical protein [Pseudomonas sp. LS1212]UVJ42857.1 hypothetical protein NVV94_20000 [Pseudomonas sp. LS1212]